MQADSQPWDMAMPGVFDFGWGAGPLETVITLQHFLGAQDDGDPGPATAQAYVRHIAANGVEATANAWADRRAQFYRSIVAHKPSQAVFLKGWLRRADSYRPGRTMWKLIAGTA